MTTIETEVPDVMTPRTLTALDRCDRCGAQAYAVAQFTGDPTRDGITQQGELLFCAHHAREHREALGTALRHDDTAKLEAQERART